MAATPKFTKIFEELFEGAEKKKRPATVMLLRELGETYDFWRDFTNFPQFMKDVSSVEKTDAKNLNKTFKIFSSHGGKIDSWSVEILHEKRSKSIAWRTCDEDRLRQIFAVTFESAPEGRGTIVRYKAGYESGVGKLLRADPDTRAYEDLRRFKAFMETGEIPTVEGQPHGREESKAA